MSEHHAAENGLITDDEWRQFQTIPDQGYSHRAWVNARIRERMAQAWDERDRARPQYLGPEDGHYPDCVGWGDCYCGTYPNPYRVIPPAETTGSEDPA